MKKTLHFRLLHWNNFFLIFLIRKCKAPEFYKYCQKSKVNVTGLEITADLKKYIYIVLYEFIFFYQKDEIKFLYIIISISVRIGKEM